MLLKFSVSDYWTIHPFIICVTSFLHLNTLREGYLTKMSCVEISQFPSRFWVISL